MDRRADPGRDDLTPTFVVPVYNEAENIGPLLLGLEQHAPPPFRVLVVYDFDEDTTLPVVRRMMPDRPWLALLRNDLGPGVLCALKKGFSAVERGPVLVVMGDLSDDLAIIPTMLDRYREGYDVVAASRYMAGGRQIGGPLLKRVLSQGAGWSLRVLARFPTHDATNNFRLYDAEMVRALGIDSERGFELALELTAKAVRAGYLVCEVPATWRDRTAGESRFQLRKWLPAYLRWYGYALKTAALSRPRRSAARRSSRAQAGVDTRG